MKSSHRNSRIYPTWSRKHSSAWRGRAQRSALAGLVTAAGVLAPKVAQAAPFRAYIDSCYPSSDKVESGSKKGSWGTTADTRKVVIRYRFALANASDDVATATTDTTRVEVCRVPYSATKASDMICPGGDWVIYNKSSPTVGDLDTADVLGFPQTNLNDLRGTIEAEIPYDYLVGASEGVLVLRINGSTNADAFVLQGPCALPYLLDEAPSSSNPHFQFFGVEAGIKPPKWLEKFSSGMNAPDICAPQASPGQAGIASEDASCIEGSLLQDLGPIVDNVEAMHESEFFSGTSPTQTPTRPFWANGPAGACAGGNDCPFQVYFRDITPDNGMQHTARVWLDTSRYSDANIKSTTTASGWRLANHEFTHAFARYWGDVASIWGGMSEEGLASAREATACNDEIPGFPSGLCRSTGKLATAFGDYQHPSDILLHRTSRQHGARKRCQ